MRRTECPLGHPAHRWHWYPNRSHQSESGRCLDCVALKQRAYEARRTIARRGRERKPQDNRRPIPITPAEIDAASALVELREWFEIARRQIL